jgi:putative transposase
VKFAAIADWAASDAYPVEFMCAQLGVSRSGFYAWRGRAPSERSNTDAGLLVVIKAAFERLRGNPGVRRMHAELQALGYQLSRKRVWRLMQAAGLQGRHPRAWKRTTVPGERPVPAPDLLGRDFTAERPNQRWCGDITYVKTWDGWAYLATVIDLHSRAVVGWAIADHMRTDLVTDALDMALAHRRPDPGVIFHSDRGTQYTSNVRDLLPEQQHPPLDGPHRNLLRQRRRRILLRQLQEGTHPHPPLARHQAPEKGDLRLDRNLLQQAAPPLHSWILDAPRIRARLPRHQPDRGLNRCPEKREHSRHSSGLPGHPAAPRHHPAPRLTRREDSSLPGCFQG